jgi:hypothetical protein
LIAEAPTAETAGQFQVETGKTSDASDIPPRRNASATLGRLRPGKSRPPPTGLLVVLFSASARTGPVNI